MPISTPAQTCPHTARSFNGGAWTGAVVCLHCHEILVPGAATPDRKWRAINFEDYDDAD